MDLPKIAGTTPIKVALIEGNTYAWCSCGLSAKQPYCDGSHKGSEFSPMVFQANETKEVHLCTCKKTSKPGFCDGTHKSL